MSGGEARSSLAVSVEGVDELVPRAWERLGGRRDGLLERTFRQGVSEIRVACEGEAQLAVFEEFIPWGDEGSGVAEPVVTRIASLVAPDLVAALEEGLARRAPARVLETFAGECLHGRFDGPAGALFAEVETPAGWPGAPRSLPPVHGYCILARGDEILVLRASAERHLLTYALRSLREVYLRQSENAGGAVLHAAAVVRGGEATVLTGAKAAGKTSLMLALASTPGFAYLGNDRVVLHPQGGGEGVTVFPFPMSCRVGVGTAEALPALSRLLSGEVALAREQARELRATDEASTRERRAFGSAVKLDFTPRDLERRLGFRLASRARLARVVLPALDPARTAPVWEPVPPAELLEELAAQAMTPHEEKWVTPWLVERRESDEAMAARVRALLSGIAETVPGFRLRFGFDYFAGGRLDPRIENRLA